MQRDVIDVVKGFRRAVAGVSSWLEPSGPPHEPSSTTIPSCERRLYLRLAGGWEEKEGRVEAGGGHQFAEREVIIVIRLAFFQV